MDFHAIRCPLQHSKIIMLGTFRTIKCHFDLSPHPHQLSSHTFYLRLMFWGSVRSPINLKPFGTLTTIKSLLAPSLFGQRNILKKNVQKTWYTWLKQSGPPLTCLTLWANLALASMYRCMTIAAYCLDIGFNYTDVHINTLAQGIKPFLGCTPTNKIL